MTVFALDDDYSFGILSSALHRTWFEARCSRLRSDLRYTSTTAFHTFPWPQTLCAYVDMKWPGAAGHSRKGVAETLTTVTPHMLATKRGKPDERTLRRALNGWAFNLNRRDAVAPPAEIADALSWLKENTRSVAVLAETGEVRNLVTLMASKLDGKTAAASVVKRKRAVIC